MSTPPTDELQWDVFISYASEDRQTLVEPLATLLADMGLRVWWDQFELKVGDSLIEKITLGLSRSRYGVVVLSHDFLGKPWPEYELQGLTARDIVGDKVILPIWYDIGFDDVVQVNPPLAQKRAIVITRPPARNDLVAACLELLEVVRPELLTRLHRRVAYEVARKRAGRVKVQASEIQLAGPPRHDELPPELLRRIRLVRAALLSAYPRTLQFWIDGFIRDAHPSREVSAWEDVAAGYLEYLQHKDLNDEERSAVQKFLLGVTLRIPVDQIPLPESLEPDRSFLAALVGPAPSVIEYVIPDEPVWKDAPDPDESGHVCDSPPAAHVEDFDERLTKEQIAMLVDYYGDQEGPTPPPVQA